MLNSIWNLFQSYPYSRLLPFFRVVITNLFIKQAWNGIIPWILMNKLKFAQCFN